MNPKSSENSKTTITELMIPSYANFGGKIHGGIILSMMDITKQAIQTVSSDKVVQTCVDMTSDHWQGKLRDLDQFMVEHCTAMQEYVSSQ